MPSTGIDALKKKLLEEAREKAESIIRDAEKRAQELIEEAKKKRSQMIEEKRREMIEKARREAEIILSEAKRMYRLEIAKAKHEVLNKVYERAREILEKREGVADKARESLEKLLSEALEVVPSGSKIKVVVNPSDREEVIRIVNEKNLPGIVDYVEACEEVLGGVIIELEDGTIIDNSYNTRLRKAFERYSKEIASILWSS